MGYTNNGLTSVGGFDPDVKEQVANRRKWDIRDVRSGFSAPVFRGVSPVVESSGTPCPAREPRLSGRPRPCVGQCLRPTPPGRRTYWVDGSTARAWSGS